MKNVRLILTTAFVGALVALTYHVFENAVHGSIHFVWDNLLNTDQNRALVFVACTVIGFVFFALQHYLDPKSEKKEDKGLGNIPNATITNFSKVLFIGFFSLLAGASLGPEAILVPACTMIGVYIGTKIFGSKSKETKVLAAAGFMALFAAFFNSILVGVLSVYLVAKTANQKVTPPLILIALVAAGASILTLDKISGEALISAPSGGWEVNLATALLVPVFVILGYGIVYALLYLEKFIRSLRKKIKNEAWYTHAMLATIGLSLIYLAGGNLIEFTGNESIQPMFEQAAELGLVGLLWTVATKVIAIGWSKTMGYRGGLIFPTVFVAGCLVAISQLYFDSVNSAVGITAVVVGAIAANKKTDVLF